MTPPHVVVFTQLIDSATIGQSVARNNCVGVSGHPQALPERHGRSSPKPLASPAQKAYGGAMLQPSAAFLSRARPRSVARWLFVVAGLIVAMVVVGGITRLTESGLSITSWKPISGIVPPLTEAQWQAEFAGYRRIPEYAAFNQGMTLTGFKHIFFWEYAHRLLGRIIGLAFAAQEVPSVPTDAHDRRLDLVVTESEVLAPSASAFEPARR